MVEEKHKSLVSSETSEHLCQPCRLFSLLLVVKAFLTSVVSNVLEKLKSKLHLLNAFQALLHCTLFSAGLVSLSKE